MPWPIPPNGPMRVRGTNLPSSQTVHDRVFGGRGVGRPVIIPPRDLGLKKDKQKPMGYSLLWQKVKPKEMEKAQADMDLYMPPGLAPSALSYVNAKRRRKSNSG